MINQRKIKWAGHVSGMGEMRNAYKTLIGNLKAKDQFKNLRADGKIILKLILNN